MARSRTRNMPGRSSGSCRICPVTETRREFLTASAMALLGVNLAQAADPIIDIHQHVGYSGRPDGTLLAHQRAMGATTTILLPAGTPVETPSTHQGKSNGLDAKALGNEA